MILDIINKIKDATPDTSITMKNANETESLVNTFKIDNGLLDASINNFNNVKISIVSLSYTDDDNNLIIIHRKDEDKHLVSMSFSMIDTMNYKTEFPFKYVSLGDHLGSLTIYSDKNYEFMIEFEHENLNLGDIESNSYLFSSFMSYISEIFMKSKILLS